MKDAKSNDLSKKNAGYKAAEYVRDGMVLGLGTGSTTHYFIEKVGMRIKKEGIKVLGIPTSFQSLLKAKQSNIPITTLEEHDIDLAVDGADEVDGDFNLIKGGGAAHTKEKIVDYAADTFIVIVDESKCVESLGDFPVPVEVLPDSSRMVIKTLEDMGAECEIRMAQRKDGPVITDNGNFVVDAKFSEIASPSHLEIDLNSIPGVVENGIFSQMVDKVIVGTSEGTKELWGDTIPFFDPYELKDIFFKIAIVVGALIVIYGILWVLVTLKLIPALVAMIFPQIVVIIIGLGIIYIALTRKRQYY